MNILKGLGAAGLKGLGGAVGLGEVNLGMDMSLPSFGDNVPEMPSIELPAFEVSLEAPSIELPTFEASLEAPSIELPTFEASLEAPSIELPTFEVSLEAPSIELPSNGGRRQQQRREAKPRAPAVAHRQKRTSHQRTNPPLNYTPGQAHVPPPAAWMPPPGTTPIATTQAVVYGGNYAPSQAPAPQQIVHVGDQQPPPDDHMILSIIVTLCCFLVFGILAVNYSRQVQQKIAAGDRAGALVASKNAKQWAIIGLIIGSIAWFVVIAAIVVLNVLSAVTAAVI